MQNKNAILDQKFNWLGSHKAVTNADVSINYVFWDKQSSADKAFHLIFRNEAAGIGEYIQLAIHKNRILIRPSKEGYHLTKRATGPNNRYLKIKEVKETEDIKRFIGDYELKYDEFYDIYYIERAEQ